MQEKENIPATERLDKERPKVSVIIPVYKTERYLSACLESVLGQTFTDWEAICVNDGSPDNCGDILQEYALKDPRIKIMTQENQGLSGARNTGLTQAQGKYIFFLDSDDTLPEYALDTLYKIATEHQVPVVASCNKKPAQTDDLPTNCQLITKHPFLQFVLNKKIHSSAWNKLYQADILKNHRFILGIYFEDWPFVTEVFADLKSYATTETACYNYREENESITRSTFNQKKAESYLTGIKAVYTYFQNRSDLRIAQKRMAIAMKMLINKTYKSHDNALQEFVSNECKMLLKNKVVHLFDLPIKTLFRLWRMK